MEQSKRQSPEMKPEEGKKDELSATGGELSDGELASISGGAGPEEEEEIQR